MIAVTMAQKADSPSLKRSFGLVAGSGTDHPREDCGEWSPYEASCVDANEITDRPPIPIPSKRRSLSSGSRLSSMPVQTSSPSCPVSFPSFMSVFGNGSDMPGGNMREEDVSANTYGQKQQNQTDQQSSDLRYPLPFPHRESVSSTNSDSTESSPTTTVSTFDGASVSDTTPSSSPESPTSVIPLSNFKTNMNEPTDQQQDEVHTTPVPNPLPEPPQPMELDSGSEKKPRKARNLSVNISATEHTSPATSFHTLDPAAAGISSEPVSPAGAASMPKPAPRNRFNLSIRTPGPEKTSFLPPTGIAPNLVPPTPSAFRRPHVRHFPSEPSLSIFSPANAPTGGMQLPPVPQQGETRLPHRLSQSLHQLKEEDRSYELPESQEKKEQGYPDGPVCIYDCGVCLYLEPSREEASKFDCVINVAKEVSCPFMASDSKGKESTVTSVMRHGHEFERHAISEPQTAVSEFSFKSAFEYQPSESPATPTTPKPEKPVPEYLHVPWDHNSDIVEDAYVLCKFIDTRVKEGKRVLVHCQLGVSRSASLIIAFGMFLDPSLDFNKAYDHVKSKSQWISPNMSLIYQLAEFRNKLNNGSFEANPRSTPSEWVKFGEPAQPPKPFVPEGVQPQEQPVAKESDRPKPLPPVPAFDGTTNMPGAFPPTPLTALTALANEGGRPVSVFDLQMPGAFPSSDFASREGTRTPKPSTVSIATQTEPVSLFPPRQLPLRKRPSAILPIHVPAREPNVEMDLASNDVPDAPSLFSPRAVEFNASPFHRTNAGDLVLHRRIESSSILRDPRSPPQRGDAVITRSIDEFL